MHINPSLAAVSLLGTASALPGQWVHAWNPSGYVPGSGSSSVTKATGWTKSLPYGTGSYKPYPTGSYSSQPHGSGSGSVPPPVTTSATTIATTGPLPTTDVEVTTTVTATLTSFVPCSTPVSSNAQTTYYSTWLTATSWTTTYETTTTSCYTITPSAITSATTLPATTVSGSASGTCPPAETVYSTIISYVTIWSESGAAQTATATSVVPDSSFTWTWGGESGHAESTGGWANPSGTAAAAAAAFGHW